MFLEKSAGSWMDPIRLLEEDRLGDHEAADLVLLRRIHRLATPVLLDPSAHRPEVRRTVPLAERFPGKLRGHDLMPREEAEATDGVVRLLEPEEEGFAGLERAKSVATRRLPEVDLLERLARCEEGEPVEIGVADEALHRPPSYRRGRLRCVDLRITQPGAWRTSREKPEGSALRVPM